MIKAMIAISLVAAGLMTSASQGKIDVKALGNPKAPVKGTFYKALSSEPEKLNPVTSTDLYATLVQGYVMDYLMIRDADTYEWVPALAESYTAEKTGKWYQFKIREGVKWHDGKPVTVEDVKFSLDSIKDPKFDTAQARPYYENIEKAEIIDKNTIRFYTKGKYFGNFNVVAGLQIVPKHVYGNPKEKKSKVLIGSGPYQVDKYQRGKSLTLKRNKDWWGHKLPYFAGINKFNSIFFRFIKDETVQLEQLKKGKVDYLDLSPEQYEKKAVGSKWGKSIFKVKTENKAPKSYYFVGWNQKRDLFKSREVRVALAQLMNRKEMINKFEYDMMIPNAGPWYSQSPYADPKVKPLAFDRNAANALLKKEGWADTDKDGVLDKKINGVKTKFEFTLMFSNAKYEKYFTLYKEDLKKSGIIMNLKRVEWNTFLNALDDNNKDPKKVSFDAVALGWGGGSVDLDPKQIWHSASAIPGGSNFIAYKNKEVDKLIEKGREELDRAKRIEMFKKVYEKIAHDAPYAFMFHSKYALYGHTKKVTYERPTYNYTIGTDYWWVK